MNDSTMIVSRMIHDYREFYEEQFKFDLKTLICKIEELKLEPLTSILNVQLTLPTALLCFQQTVN